MNFILCSCCTQTFPAPPLSPPFYPVCLSSSFLSWREQTELTPSPSSFHNHAAAGRPLRRSMQEKEGGKSLFWPLIKDPPPRSSQGTRVSLRQKSLRLSNFYGFEQSLLHFFTFSPSISEISPCLYGENPPIFKKTKKANSPFGKTRKKKTLRLVLTKRE